MLNKIPVIKNGAICGSIDLNDIDLVDTNLSAFFNDGKAYREVTSDIIERLYNNELIITEYHEQPLGNVIYVDAVKDLN